MILIQSSPLWRIENEFLVYRECHAFSCKWQFAAALNEQQIAKSGCCFPAVWHILLPTLFIIPNDYLSATNLYELLLMNIVDIPLSDVQEQSINQSIKQNKKCISICESIVYCDFLLIILLIVGVLIDNKAFVCLFV